MQREMVTLSRWMQGPWRIIAAVLLLVIATHAISPVGQPLNRDVGSAFSAATANVSLACAQQVLVVKNTLPDNSPQPLPAMLALALVAVAVTDCRSHEIGLGPTGPPYARIAFHPLNPRAPPAV